ncbi:AAA family ATPase [Nonomuraea sp. NPDC049158]|uniref:AAA family ATPase n=1 Tax=Nonomuraea sp. NPDC049158 TaxID=3155649 RepID=UPI0033EBEE9A
MGEFSPYRGLAAFGPEDARFFFGREEMTATLVDRVAEQLTRPGALLVVGPSGAGKSSLLKAGLIPTLSRIAGPGAAPGLGTTVVSLVPGRDPVDALAGRLAALTGAGHTTLVGRIREDPPSLRETLRAWGAERGGRLVVIVDQFEQVFDKSLDEQTTFVRALHALCAEPVADAPAVVVLGMRADFFGHASAHRELKTALARPVVVDPMTPDQLRSAISRPAELADLTLEEGLVEVVLKDLGASAEKSATGAGGLLPLLSHALLSTWHNLDHRTLTLAGYHATGGIAESLARSAAATLDQLDLAGRTMARRLLPRLVRLSEDAHDSARALPLADLLPPASSPDHAVARQVLERFTRARLLTLDTDTAQITHEALIRSWPTLRSWIEADRAVLLLHQQLGHDAQDWLRSEHDAAYLYRGTRLSTALQARTRWEGDPSRYPPLSALATEFLDAGVRADARAAHRARRTRTVLAVSLSAALLASLVITGLVLRSMAAEREQSRAVLSRQLAAQSDALTGSEPNLSRLLAATAFDYAPTPEARQSILNTLANPARATLIGHRGPIYAVAAGQLDGRPIAVSGGEDGTIRIWDLHAFQPVGAPLTGHTSAVSAITLGELNGLPIVVSGSRDGSIRIWDLRAGKQLDAPLRDSGDTAFSLTIAQVDGTPAIVVGGESGMVESWNLSTRASLGTPLNGLSGFVDGVASGRLGATPIAVSSTQNGKVQVWDLKKGEQIGDSMTGHDGSAGTVAVTDVDGVPAAISGGDDGTLRLWDLKTRKERGAPLIGHRGAVEAVAAGPADGRAIAVSGGQDGTVRGLLRTGNVLSMSWLRGLLHVKIAPAWDALPTRAFRRPLTRTCANASHRDRPPDA